MEEGGASEASRAQPAGVEGGVSEVSGVHPVAMKPLVHRGAQGKLDREQGNFPPCAPGTFEIRKFYN